MHIDTCAGTHTIIRVKLNAHIYCHNHHWQFEMVWIYHQSHSVQTERSMVPINSVFPMITMMIINYSILQLHYMCVQYPLNGS